MKNRDRYIHKVNEYDMLIKIQKISWTQVATVYLTGLQGKKLNVPKK